MARRLWRDGAAVAVVVGLMAAVSLLPPDTALQEVQAGGVLRACVPVANAPLVIEGGPQEGIDVDILRQIASDLGLRLSLNHNPAIGRELDPRVWRINRATCHILGGGIVTSPVMESFMQVTDPHLESGWTVISPVPVTSLDGLTVGVLVGMVGRDRIALSRLLRAHGARIELVETEDQLRRGLLDGRFDAGIADTILAGSIAEGQPWALSWLEDDGHDALGFALWKGDMTLSRAVEDSLEAMRRDGRLDAIIASYGVGQPAATLPPPEGE